jgi:hypothetical protein
VVYAQLGFCISPLPRSRAARAAAAGRSHTHSAAAIV